MAEALHVWRSCIYFVVIFKLQVPSPLLATLKKTFELDATNILNKHNQPLILTLARAHLLCYPYHFFDF